MSICFPDIAAMSKRVKRLRELAAQDLSEDFYISASAATNRRSASITPSLPEGESVSIEQPTADGRRVHRETLPIPTSSLSSRSASPAPSSGLPPLTVNTIPDWDTFFRPDEDHSAPSMANELQEHARRYVNSVSTFLCGIDARRATTDLLG